MISIEIPEEIASNLRLPPMQIELHLKRELAIHLVREGICNLAQGAKLAEMPRLAFERLLGERKIPWRGNIEDVRSDLRDLSLS
jgi:predicted HTH domain antitoxin